MAGVPGISAIASLATLPLKAGFAALSIAGGVLNIAGSTLASANLLTTGALMASGGLHGRRSGNVKKDEAKQTQMAESSGKKKGPTGGGGGGGTACTPGASGAGGAGGGGAGGTCASVAGVNGGANTGGGGGGGSGCCGAGGIGGSGTVIIRYKFQ